MRLFKRLKKSKQKHKSDTDLDDLLSNYDSEHKSLQKKVEKTESLLESVNSEPAKVLNQDSDSSADKNDLLSSNVAELSAKQEKSNKNGLIGVAESQNQSTLVEQDLRSEKIIFENSHKKHSTTLRQDSQIDNDKPDKRLLVEQRIQLENMPITHNLDQQSDLNSEKHRHDETNDNRADNEYLAQSNKLEELPSRTYKNKKQLQNAPMLIKQNQVSTIRSAKLKHILEVKSQGSDLLIDDIKQRKLFVVEKRYEKNKLSRIGQLFAKTIWYSYSQIENNVTYRILTFVTVGSILLIVIIIIIFISIRFDRHHGPKEDNFPTNYFLYLGYASNYLSLSHNTISFNLAIIPSVFAANSIVNINYKHHSDTNYDFSFYTTFVNISTQQPLNHRFLIKVNVANEFTQVIASHDYTDDSIFANVNGDWQQCRDDINTLDPKDPIDYVPDWEPVNSGFALFPAQKDKRISVYYINIISTEQYVYQFKVDLDLDTIYKENAREFNVAHGNLTYQVHHITGYNSDYHWTNVGPY